MTRSYLLVGPPYVAYYLSHLFSINILSDRDLDYWDHTDKNQANNRRRTFWELITLEGWLVCNPIPSSVFDNRINLSRV